MGLHLVRLRLASRLLESAHHAVVLAPAVICAVFAPTASAAEDVLIELHFQPVPQTQIAIWLEDANGEFVQDVFVTQATGTLGIGNRPGLWDYLSSWRFPYGPRPQVLPVWAHARGRSYPALRYYDDDASYENSYGWHENASSFEPYFCRPLMDSENATIATDTMTCPSPAVFQSDKGTFDGTSMSVYPPRNDLVQFEDGGDSPDVPMFSVINDLDAVTGATPLGDAPEFVTAVIPKAVAELGTLAVYIEVNLEHDENEIWAFDRDADHFVDPWLSAYGVEYLGQPSVVYRVEFAPLEKTFTGTDAYLGYGEWDGTSGTLHPPDDSISTQGGSGADRLQLITKNDETFRFGVYSHGPNSGEDPTGGGEDGGTSADSEASGGADGGDDGWGGDCDQRSLPAVEDLELEAVDFDRVRIHFTVPETIGSDEVHDVRVYYRSGQMAITEENVSSTVQVVPGIAGCSSAVTPGLPMWCEIDELFGNFDYQIAMKYVDRCNNKSELATSTTRTPARKFQTIEGGCFIATAAWGAAWSSRVSALRFFRDAYMRQTGFGTALVEFYYLNSPALARAIAPRPWARALSRSILLPFADIATATTRGIKG